MPAFILMILATLVTLFGLQNDFPLAVPAWGFAVAMAGCLRAWFGVLVALGGFVLAGGIGVV